MSDTPPGATVPLPGHDLPTGTTPQPGHVAVVSSGTPSEPESCGPHPMGSGRNPASRTGGGSGQGGDPFRTITSAIGGRFNRLLAIMDRHPIDCAFRVRRPDGPVRLHQYFLTSGDGTLPGQIQRFMMDDPDSPRLAEFLKAVQSARTLSARAGIPFGTCDGVFRQCHLAFDELLGFQVLGYEVLRNLSARQFVPGERVVPRDGLVGHLLEVRPLLLRVREFGQHALPGAAGGGETNARAAGATLNPGADRGAVQCDTAPEAGVPAAGDVSQVAPGYTPQAGASGAGTGETDGPFLVSCFRYQGRIEVGISEKQWRLLQALWDEQAGRPKGPQELLTVWRAVNGRTALTRDTLKKLKNDLNNTLCKKNLPFEAEFTSRGADFLVLSPTAPDPNGR